MIADLVRALLSALVAGVLPGYFWASFVQPTAGIAERLGYSAVLSMAMVPPVAIVLTMIAGSGVTLAISVAAILIVAGSGGAMVRLRGVAPGPAEPALPRPRPALKGYVLALILAALIIALASALGMPSPGWLLLLTLAVLVSAGLLARDRARQSAVQQREPAPRDRVSAADEPAGNGQPRRRPAGAVGPGGGREGHGVPGGRPAGLEPPLRPLRSSAAHATALAAVLALTAVRAYLGVIWHDWPYVRGEDQFSHAVMTEQMLAHGSYASYLIYPPGFSTLSAVICRLSGLAPLSLFPVLAPALLLLTTLGAYVLATRLWGRGYGLAAAVISGLVLVGPYVSFAGGLYPDLIAAFFLLVMVVAALVSLYSSPSARSGFLVAVVGASVVLYHSVGTLYLVLLLGAVVIVGMPYLLLLGGPEGRRLAGALTRALAGLGALSLVYAWHIYGLGWIFEHGSAARTQIDIDVGTQPVLQAGDLLSWVGSPVVWLGVLGFALLVRATRGRPGQVLSAITVLAWCAVMYLGSRFSVDGFPQRFERDVGAPLSVLAALGIGVIVQSLAARRAADASSAGGQPAATGPPVPARSHVGIGGPVAVGRWAGVVPRVGAGGWAAVRRWAAVALRAGMDLAAAVPRWAAAVTRRGAAVTFWVVAGRRSAAWSQGTSWALAGRRAAGWSQGTPSRATPALARCLSAAVVVIATASCAVQAAANLVSDSRPDREVLPRAVALAGEWLREHNTGGTVISTPDLNRGITNRAVLAMGGYTGLQSYDLFRVQHPRSLPPAGRSPLVDSREVLLNPATCRAADAIRADSVRFIFLYRIGNEANYLGFRRDPAEYTRVFENSLVVIYAPRPEPPASCTAGG